MGATLENPDRVHSIESLIYGDPSILYFNYIKDDLQDHEKSFISDLESSGFWVDYVLTNQNNIFYVVRSNS